ncbi:hypothetical protein L7F22_051995 [Adiantum nelumboides]|nr:hypothetical protein [Adiantum nelumboides]
MLLLPLFCTALALLSALFLLTAAFKLYKPRPWPPGPRGWPLIGHLHLLGDLPHQSLCSISKIYGPLMGLRLGRVPTIVVSSPAMAKEILQTHDLAFAYRPRLAAAVHMYFNCTDMGFAPYGPYWKLLRQLFFSELFSRKRLEASRHVREEEVRALTHFLVDTVREKALQEPMELRASLLATSNNINCRMAIGKRITEISNHGVSEKGDLLSLVEEMLHLLSVFYVGDFIPWLAWLDPHGYLKRMKAAGRKSKEVMQAIIDERREDHRKAVAVGETVTQNDLLDVLLHAATSPADGVVITDDNIKANIMDVFVGGSDTSSVTVEWALADLINNPQVMDKVQDELDRVVGKARLVAEDDTPNLPYLAAVLKESMRLHPSLPLLLAHEASQECEINGYKIPKKTLAYVKHMGHREGSRCLGKAS